MKKLVGVNPNQCHQIGKVLGGIHIRENFYQREYLTMDVDIETRLWMYFVSVGICHQTYVLHSKKLKLFGWDYLEHIFIKLARSNSALLNPAFISKSDDQLIIDRIRSAFTDDVPDNCTLDRLEERTRLMKDLAAGIIRKYDGKLVDFISEKKIKLIDAQKGFYHRLGQFEAYADPLFKKSTLLVKFLVEAGFIEVLDPENYIPIMDYHMQRVLLRMGCVEVVDKQLEMDLKKKRPLASDAVVREACIDAIRLIAEVSGHPITIMNDFFWPLGRSCCNETLLCRDHQCEKSPCSFFLMADLREHEHCIFEGLCKAASDDNFRDFWQPVVKTHYY